jgi:hypothetical protein
MYLTRLRTGILEVRTNGQVEDSKHMTQATDLWTEGTTTPGCLGFPHPQSSPEVPETSQELADRFGLAPGGCLGYSCRIRIRERTAAAWQPRNGTVWPMMAWIGATTNSITLMGELFSPDEGWRWPRVYVGCGNHDFIDTGQV